MSREIIEETGYESDVLYYIQTFFVSPGGTSERIHLYYARLDTDDPRHEGGGLDSEHEDIRVLHITVDDALNKLQQGEILDAFDKFYSKNIVMEEEDKRREGKEANREYEEQFVGGLTEFRGAEARNVAVNEAEGVAFVEWYMDFAHEAFGDVARHQVAVQHWEDGQVKREHFFYGE